MAILCLKAIPQGGSSAGEIKIPRGESEVKEHFASRGGFLANVIYSAGVDAASAACASAFCFL